MKKIFLLHVLLSLLFIKTSAQNNLPPLYEIKNDTASQFYLDTAYYQVLEGEGGKFTFNQVSQPPVINRFQSKGIRLKGAKFTSTFFWLRFRIKNATNKEIKVALPALGDETDFYIVRDANQPKEQKTGQLIPQSERDGYKRINAIPVTLTAGEEVLVYSKVRNFSSLDFPTNFKITVYTQKFIDQEYIINGDEYVPLSKIRDSFLGAILLIGAILNLLFFFINRERVYLFFSLFLLCLFVPASRLIEIIGREHFVLAFYIGNLYVFWPFFFFQFMRYYLQTYRFLPTWDKLIFFISVVGLLSLFASGTFFNFDSSLPVFTISLICYLITPFLVYKKNKPSARLFVIASLPFSLSLTIYTSMVILGTYFGVFISNSLSNAMVILNSISWGWLIIFFLWLLFRQYDRQKREIAEQALQAERFIKEKEIERRGLIEKQKIELEKTVEERTAELKQSLQELKSTQAQLIHQEKMASLGELTAGIAHEIQNPLNFVNNFSEVNNELIEELQSERSKVRSERDEALEDEIVNDIKQNLEKINHHGKRADAIVKGMLQHSKSSTGIKEPTDINKLADEYLRLAYHGTRARDKEFNAEFKTDFDESIGKINIVSQDIGRVLLNLFNNAFYAVNQKQKYLTGSTNLSGQQHYAPTITVVTKKVGDKIAIRVEDNGNGIPQNIIYKIFQPFFTTKPTGQGTGLGLSLAYDIIKAHGGEIRVESKEGEGSEFTVQLPIV